MPHITHATIRHLLRVCMAFCLLSLGSMMVGVAQRDSTQSMQLQVVDITDNGSGTSLARPSAAAVQSLSALQIQHLPTLQLSDALKYLSGVVIKDYGGIGGLKTISVRGLGSQHTGMLYDGIPITDCQTGQIDLGKLSLDNISSVELTVGTDESVLLPARAHSYSNLIRLRTFQTLPDKPLHLKTAITFGSYGMVSPLIQCTHLIKSRKYEHRFLIWNLNASYLQSKGDYLYTLHYGGVRDSVSLEKRQNTDIATFNTEANVLVQLRQGEQLSFKGYYYDSHRGLPNATILYNLNASQRLDNHNGFGQMNYRKIFNRKWSYLLNAKFNYDYTHYLDPEYLNEAHRLDNTYQQYEGYISNAVCFAPLHKKIVYVPRGRDLFLGLANDLFYNQLESDNIDYQHPARFTSMTALTARYQDRRWAVNGNLLLTTVNNMAQDTTLGSTFVHLSPALSLSVQAHKHFRVRAFFKDIFRMPTFNDLYYREVGNLNLQPEKTWQWDLGFTGETPKLWNGCFSMAASIDGYYNIVRDKIVAFPTRNLFSWSMINYGRVHIAGAEINLRGVFTIHQHHHIMLNANCTYQYAVDRTDPGYATYNHQIPYTPRWAGSISTTAQIAKVCISYAVMLSGKRYALGENIPENEVAGYADHSLAVQYETKIDECTLGLKVELLNLSDKNYEVVRNYPMQGTSFRMKVYFQY